MEKCLSDELNSKMNNLKCSISEHDIEQGPQRIKESMFGQSLPR